MITVESVLDSNAKKGTEVAKDNEEVLKTGSVRAVKKSYWPWILLAVGAIAAGWYFLRKKKNEGETIHS